MRLEAMHLQEPADPEAWVRSAAATGYRAAVLPCDAISGDDVVRDFARATARHDVLIAEVGAWGNVPGDSDRGDAGSLNETRLQGHCTWPTRSAPAARSTLQGHGDTSGTGRMRRT
jgi:hypothetical protein